MGKKGNAQTRTHTYTHTHTHALTKFAMADLSDNGKSQQGGKRERSEAGDTHSTDKGKAPRVASTVSEGESRVRREVEAKPADSLYKGETGAILPELAKGGGFGAFASVQSSQAGFGAFSNAEEGAGFGGQRGVATESPSNVLATEKQGAKLFEGSEATEGQGGSSHSKHNGDGSREEQQEDEAVKLAGEPQATGEEGESVIVEAPASMYEFHHGEGNKQWRERGKGTVRVNRHEESGKKRIIMRANGNLRVMLNATVFEGMRAELVSQGKGVTFPCVNVAGKGEDEGASSSPQFVALRFKNGECMSTSAAAERVARLLNNEE